ncbi:MAG: glycerate kinase [Kiritimatiellae bacterium]|nr:glycerate kinase [Kiritimatiellia bacterium]
MKKTVIAIAPDSFKGSLTALEAAECIERGLKNVLKNITCRKIPMADGGEGTVSAIVESTGGRFVTRTVQGPLGHPVKAQFGLSGDGKTAVIEMAAASGLVLLKPRQRNPLKTSTYGTGQLIKHALKLGVKHVLIGIGGSATNDGGTGMARALGWRFLDAQGKPVPEGGGALNRLATIDARCVDKRLAHVTVEVACDVDNPLTGRHGAAHVYGPQKGATPQMVKQLDANLEHLAAVIDRSLSVDILTVPGSGAAGGLGGGLMAFAGGVLRPGVDIVIDCVKLPGRMKGCSLVITGEGRMDSQTAFGKTPAGVARTAKKLKLPVIAICGSLGVDTHKVHDVGIDAYFASLERSLTEEELPTEGPAMLTRCAEQVGRLIAMKLPRGSTLALRK